jgi:hypothetical protein
LKNSADKGIICFPDESSLTCYADASFLGEWNRERTDDPIAAKSRKGYIIMYASCPVSWCSKLQTDIAHSSTEAEYIALSHALKEVTAIMYILQELKDHNFNLNTSLPTIHCKVFEDNAGAIEMARLPKMRPRTKHLNMKYHHFRGAVSEKKIHFEYIPSKQQLADMMTKAVIILLFEAMRFAVQGW